MELKCVGRKQIQRQIKMEHEAQLQEGQPPVNKQAYIYKKNPTSGAKAITRKLRTTNAPSEPYIDHNNSKLDDMRTSHNEAETIATQGQQSGISPRTAALSQENFGRLGPGVVLASDQQRRPMDNRRFHTSHRGTGRGGQNQTYYEDNIDSETEVFIDPQFESKLDNQRSRDLFPARSSEFNSQMRVQRKRSQEDHVRAIDAVMNSNHDDDTKQRLIADIQSKYRNQQKQMGQTEKVGKPRNNKKFKDHHEEELEHHPARRNKQNAEDLDNAKARTAKQSNKQRRRKQMPDYDDHQKYLMPEMEQFLGDNVDRQNYLTQDEAGDSRMATIGNNKKRQRAKNDSGLNSQDENFKMKNFTPGRIRASRIGLQNLQEYPSQQNNYIGSPGASQELARNALTDQKRRAHTKVTQNTGRRMNDSVNDSIQSTGHNQADYNQHLPSVRTKKKKKKSPSNSGSPNRDRNSSGRGDNGSISRMSAGLIDKKLKPTLDQGLHFMPASVKVPAKQTEFYDNVHGSAITQQQMQQWKIKNGEVILDAFNKNQKKVPTNRHRIPNVGGADMDFGKPGRKLSPVDKDAFIWDMDGRRHKKSSKKHPVVITSNVSLHKVDLPNIRPSNLSPKGPGNKSQPPGKMPRMPEAPSTKFIDPMAPGVTRKLKNPPTHLNVQSDAGLSLIDIDLKPNKDPTAKIHEPPFNEDLPMRDEPNEPNQPDYTCPVCKERVPGRQTAKHSRDCRTHRCRFCHTEQPIAELDKHEQNCGKIDPPKDLPPHERRDVRVELCRFCRKEFKMSVLLAHEAICHEAVKCPFCNIELAKLDYHFHLQRCPEVAMCRFCGNQYRSKDIDEHEAKECPEVSTCQFCGLKMPRSLLDNHIIKSCPKAKPGVTGDEEVDPRPYKEMLDKNASKLKRKSTKVVVEDDFIKPTDFRDPSGRKQSQKDPSQSNPSGKFKPDGSMTRSIDKGSLDRSKTGKESSAAKPPLSPMGPQSPKLKGSKFNGAITMSDQKSKGILKQDPKSPKRDASRSNSRNKNNGTINSGRSSGKGSRRGNQTRQGSNDDQMRRSRISQDLKHLTNDLPTSGEQDLRPPAIDDKSIAIQSEILQQNDQPLHSSLSGSQGNMGKQTDADGAHNTIDPEQQQTLTGEDYKESKGMNRKSQNMSMSQISQDVKLTKTKSMQAVSQVRFAHHASETHVHQAHEQRYEERIQTNHSQEHYSVKKVKQRESKVSSKTKVTEETMRRVTTQEAGFRKKSLSRKSDVRRNATQDAGSRDSAGNSKMRRSMYFPDEGQKRSSINSRKSQSPETRRVMETLTHHRVKIDEKTKLLINGREVLTHKGIKGNIHKVGVGFGTGRHTSGRRLDLLKEVPIQDERPERTASEEREGNAPIYIPAILSHHRREPSMRDVWVQNTGDMHSEGCDPITKSMRSQVVSAHVSHRDINLSARTATVHPDVVSQGVSAKPISQRSVREQADQVTEGRFEPHMFNAGIGTDSRLLDDYFMRSMHDADVNTGPVIFGEPKPRMRSCMVQTEVILDESNLPDEPQLFVTSHEPIIRQKNLETGSNGSLLDEPQPDETIQVPECSYVDDWYDSEVYKYSFEMHYEKMVKKKLIRVELVKRPEVPEEHEGLNAAQKLEMNLNPQGLEILSQIECEYGQATLRHKSANLATQEVLQDLFLRARKTIEVLEINMVRPDVSSSILFQHYQTVTKKNVIKLLIRVKKMYEARNESIILLKMMMEVDAFMQPKELVWRVLQDNRKQPLNDAEKSLIGRALKVLSDGLTHITIFQQEHRLFRDEFRFNQKSYRAYLRDVGKIVGGFLQLKGEPNPALQETGLLQEEHEEHEAQTKRYEEWCKASHEEYGQLEVPGPDEIEQTMQPEKPNRKVKGSRIDRALEKMRQEQALKSETNSNMELTSKSKILAQMQFKMENYDEELTKTNMSDQMLERMQQKREKIAKQNLIKVQGEEGYQMLRQSQGRDTRLSNPNQMEDQAFYNLNQGHKVGERGMSDSILSHATDPHFPRHHNALVTGNYEDYKEFSVGKFDFNTSSISNGGYREHAVQEPRLNAALQQRNQVQSKFQSQMLLQPEQQFSQNERPFQSRFDQNGNMHEMSQMAHTPSEGTMLMGGLSTKNIGNYANVNISDIEGDNGTEFTEQIDNDDQKIDLEMSVQKLDHSAIEDETIFGENEYVGTSSKLKILNHGSVKIKYAASSQNASRQALDDEALASPDSLNERHQ